jgi:hypothetical protein
MKATIGDGNSVKVVSVVKNVGRKIADLSDKPLLFKAKVCHH